MNLVTYPTAEAVLAAFWRFDELGLTLEEFCAGELGGVDEDGAEVISTGRDVLAGLQSAGYWGYCDTATQTVHVWASPDASPAEVIYLLGHEIGHATGTPIAADTAEGELAEEARADGYGAVAQQAYQWLTELLPEALSASAKGAKP